MNRCLGLIVNRLYIFRKEVTSPDLFLFFLSKVQTSITIELNEVLIGVERNELYRSNEKDKG